MRKFSLAFAILLMCTSAFAQYFSESMPTDWIILNQKGLQANVISQDVSMEGMDYAYNSPTTMDGSGNFYYCTSAGNPNGYLWIVKKVNKASGSSDEILRLNLKKYKAGTIRAINFSGGSLYMWLAINSGGSKGWSYALIEISGF